MKLKLDNKSSRKACKLQTKHGKKKSHVNESKSQPEKQNDVELDLEQEAPTLDEATVQQHLDSSPPFDCSEVCRFYLFSGNLLFQFLNSCWTFVRSRVVVFILGFFNQIPYNNF